MKKLILFLLLFPTLCFADMNPYIAGQTVAGGGSSYSDIIYYHDCNAEDDANKSSGSATVTYGTSWSIDSSNPEVGSGAWTTTATAYERVVIPLASNFSITEGRFGFYLRVDDTDTTGTIVRTNDTGDLNITFYESTNGTFKTEYRGGSDYLSYGTLTEGVWYFIELAFHNNEVTLYKSGASLGSVSGTDSIVSTNLYFGPSGAATAYSIDQVISSNDYERDIDAIKTITDFD